MKIYMIQAGKDGPVKIGITGNMPKRLTHLQIGNPVKLAVLRTIDDCFSIHEKWLHHHFLPLSLGCGEWFKFDKEMLTIELPSEAEMESILEKRRAAKAFITLKAANG